MSRRVEQTPLQPKFCQRHICPVNHVLGSITGKMKKAAELLAQPTQGAGRPDCAGGNGDSPGGQVSGFGRMDQHRRVGLGLNRPQAANMVKMGVGQDDKFDL